MDHARVAISEGYTIRVVEEDCSDLLALRRLWFPGPDAELDDDFRAWWARERHQRHALVAYADGMPVGMANGQVFSRMPAAGRPRSQWLYAANVFVTDPHRGRGLGTSLMLRLIHFARANGMVRVVLAPSEMSVPLYESLGFRPADDLLLLDLDT